MAYLVPVIDDTPEGVGQRLTDKFKAVDENGRVLAEGHLEIELIPGATRHGTVSFVTTDDDKRPAAAGGSPLERAMRGEA